MIHYEISVKVEAVRLYLEEGINYRQIAQQLGIRKSDRIEKWVNQYRQEGKAGLMKPIGRPRKLAMDEKAYIARLEMENKLLKKFHSELRKSMLAQRNIGQSTTIKKNSK